MYEGGGTSEEKKKKEPADQMIGVKKMCGRLENLLRTVSIDGGKDGPPVGSMIYVLFEEAAGRTREQR